jgi:phosphatidate phosphatase APP1
MVDWLRLGADMEELATQTLRSGKQVTGLLRPMVIQPYRGFVADGVAHVRARVMEKPHFVAGPEGLRIDATLAANLLRWVVLDMPGVGVTVTVAGQTVDAMSNADGFVIAKVPVGDLAPGWHTVDFQAQDRGRDVTARGRVVNPDRASQVGVISDIDDTVLRTGMTEGLKAVQRTLLRDAHGRKPVPGTPSLYRGLARGQGGRPESTFFYVSSGPWHLYDMLVQFLGVRGFPRGPLFMTDWRPGPPRIVQPDPAESAARQGHKRARIRRILDAYPELSYVLIGDSGERDAEIYAEFLESDPDRILAAFIRDVRAPAAGDQGGRGPDDVPDTSQLIVVRDSIELAEIALRLGLIDEFTVEEVHAEIDAQF